MTSNLALPDPRTGDFAAQREPVGVNLVESAGSVTKWLTRQVRHMTRRSMATGWSCALSSASASGPLSKPCDPAKHNTQASSSQSPSTSVACYLMVGSTRRTS